MYISNNNQAPIPPLQYQNPQHMPVQPPAQYQNPQRIPAQQGVPIAQESTTVENWIGRNVFGIVAAILVFLGLVFLGFLVIPTLGDVLKIALLFAFSLALIGAGILLTKRGKNTFTLALLGCGSGSLFISIMLSHTYFGVLPDIAAFGLLLVWLGGTLALVKLSDSLFLSIIAHVGMVISLCFAYSVGMSEDRIILLLVYQALSVGLITTGNIICFKKTYRVGLFISLALSAIALGLMVLFYADALDPFDTGALIAACFAVLVQIIGACVLSYLIYVSLRQIESQSACFTLQSLNKLTLVGILFFGAFIFPLLALSPLFESAPSVVALPYLPLMIALGISFLFVCGQVIASIVLSKAGGREADLATLSIATVMAYASVLALAVFLNDAIFYPSFFRIPGFIILAALLIICSRVTQRRSYTTIAWVLLGVDFFFMLINGYAALARNTHLIVAFAYLALYLGYLIFEWKTLDADKQARYGAAFKTALLIVYELSLVSIIAALPIDSVFAFLGVTGAFLILYITKWDSDPNDGLWFRIAIQVQAYLLILFNSWHIGLNTVSDSDLVPYAILSIASGVLLAYLLLRVKSDPSGKLHGLAAVIGILFTILVLNSVRGLTPWFDEPYVFTITLMITALICIVIGFAARLKSIRLYGLIAVLICVLRLVLLDIGNADTVMRVIAFIAGGIICFGISALYNYAVKRFDEVPMPSDNSAIPTNAELNYRQEIKH